MKKNISILLIATLLSVASAFAQGGETGTLTWSIENDTLTISGEGVMPDYGKEYGAIPWYFYRNAIAAVVVENGVTHIGEWAFLECVRLTSVDISNSVTSIGSNAFRYCDALASITLPDSVATIASDTFHNCSSLTSITIPNSVISIENHAFYCCHSLASVVFSENMTRIGEGAFQFCYNLASVAFPDSMLSIGKFAFAYCWKLASITLPSSITEIEDYAFVKCEALTSITNFNLTPIDITSDVFLGVDKAKCVLQVPKIAIPDYENAAVWKDFNIIIGIEDVGIAETQGIASLKIYPNPTRGEIQVENGELKIENVEIYDVFGRKQKTIFNFQFSTFNLTDLPAGIYFIHIQTDEGAVVRKVVKQ